MYATVVASAVVDALPALVAVSAVVVIHAVLVATVEEATPAAVMVPVEVAEQ